MISAVICVLLRLVWHLHNLPCVSVLFWLISIARYVFKSPSICFWATKYDVYCEWVANLLYKFWRRTGEIVTSCRRISANSLWVLLPYPNWFFLSFQEWQTHCLTHNFTRRSLRGGRPVFRCGGMTRMTNQSTTDQGIPDKSRKTDFTIPYLPSESILNQSMKRLFRWKQISPPLKLETLIAIFWLPETTKRPRCIMVSDNGSLKQQQQQQQRNWLAWED